MVQKVILVALVIAAGICAYPPFFVLLDGRRIFRGYSFFFDPPSLVDQIDLSRLIVQLIFLGAATAAVVILLRGGTKKNC